MENQETAVPTDFAALIGKAQGIDNGQAEYSQAIEEGRVDERGHVLAPDPDAAAMEWMFVGEMLGFVAKAILPETAPHYTEAQSLNLARAFVPVAEKYGWSGNRLAPELALVMAGIGFGMPAYMAFRVRKLEAAQQSQGGEADGRRE